MHSAVSQAILTRPEAHGEQVLRVNDLSVTYTTPERSVQALHNVSLQVDRRDILGVVGESGSGKSTLAYAIMGHLGQAGTVTNGSIQFFDRELTRLPRHEWFGVRGRQIAMVFQDPQTALHPAYTVGEQIAEALRHHFGLSKTVAMDQAVDWLERVNLPAAAATAHRFPHQLSGGQQQRVVIAMAFSLQPHLLLMDEPTTGLDTTTQARILELIHELQATYEPALLYITHDLGVVANLCNRVVVMQHGRVVESGMMEKVFREPSDSYTRHLLESIPRVDRPAPWRVVEQGAEKQTATGRHTPLLQIQGVKKHYKMSGRDARVYAVNGVDLALVAGETLAVIGESGCGKSTLAKCIVGLEAPTEGDIVFNGQTLAPLSTSRDRQVQKDIQIVFQNPDSSLNPRKTIREILLRPLELFGIGQSRAERITIVKDLLEAVRLSNAYLDRYPAQLSGGEKQRVGIARAFSTRPDLVVCDEPVSALDVSVQGVVLELFAELQKEFGTAYVFISHDLGVVRQIADRVAVMYLGQVVEDAEAEAFFHPPHHPYTEALLAAVRTPDPRKAEGAKVKLRGAVPSATELRPGCPFHNRCFRSLGTVCEQQVPPYREDADGHRVRCHIPLEELMGSEGTVERG